MFHVFFTLGVSRIVYFDRFLRDGYKFNKHLFFQNAGVGSIWRLVQEENIFYLISQIQLGLMKIF
jgi:hypothetical protein